MIMFDVIMLSNAHSASMFLMVLLKITIELLSAQADTGVNSDEFQRKP